MIHNIVKFLFIFLYMGCFLFYCKTNTSHVSEKITTNTNISNFYKKEFQKNEAFMVYISSKDYLVRKNPKDFFKTLSYTKDDIGNNYFSQSLNKYNKINYTNEATLRVELHPGTNKLSKVRFLRSSGISEIDPLLAEDISRWQFSNNSQKSIFFVRYIISLENTISKDEAKQILHKHIQKN